MKQTHHRQTLCTNQQSEEWARLIRKLRWIGMDEEAHQLQRALCSVPPHERYSVLTKSGGRPTPPRRPTRPLGKIYREIDVRFGSIPQRRTLDGPRGMSALCQ